MKTIRKKSAGLKGAAWMLCLSMLMTAVEPLAVQAEETIDVSSVIASETTEQTASEEAGQTALEETEQTVSGDIGEDVLSEIENDTEKETTAGTGGTSEMVSSEIPSQTLPEWTAKIEDNVLTVDIKDAEAGLPKTGNKWCTYFYATNKKVGYAEFSGTSCTVTANFNLASLQALDDGLYNMIADEYVKSATASYFVKRVAQFYIEKKDGAISFHSVYPEENAAILDTLNAKPEENLADYTNPATVASVQAESYEEVVQKAKDLVKYCSTNEQKIQEIHDWICNNLAYDYKMYYNGGYVENQLDYAFQNKRAVCAGFAALGTTMFRAAGIPCVTVSGISTSSGKLKDTADKGQGHAWNAVYYNGA